MAMNGSKHSFYGKNEISQASNKVSRTGTTAILLSKGSKNGSKKGNSNKQQKNTSLPPPSGGRLPGKKLA